MGDAGDQLGAPDLDPAREILRGLDRVRGISFGFIISVQGQPHLTLVKISSKWNVSEYD